VHALDTRDVTARCIDLDRLDLSTLTRLRLRLSGDGRTVGVVDGAKRVLAVDTRTLAVRVPGAGGGLPKVWIASLAAIAALLALGIGSARGRSGRRAASDTALRRAESATAEAARN
jgi:hypothetical protein